MSWIDKVDPQEYEARLREALERGGGQPDTAAMERQVQDAVDRLQGQQHPKR